MRTLIENGWILTMDPDMSEYRKGHLVMEDDTIVYVGEATVQQHIDHIIDAKGGIIIPGMINTHSHMAMIPFRSLGDDCPDRLRRFLFPLEQECMNESLAYLSAKYAAIEMVSAGITTVVDMYYFMDQIALACEKVGIRALLGETIVQQGSCDAADGFVGLQLGEQFISEWKDSRLITPIIAPHATNTNDPEIFEKAMDLAIRYDTMMTTHVAEMDYEMRYFQDTYHMTPIAWLDHIHCLNEHVLAAHCIHVNEDDLSLMKRRKVSVAHCPIANMKAGKGISPIRDMVRYGIEVGLGSDGPCSGNTLELFGPMRCLALAQKTKYHDRSLFTTKEIVRMATIDGAKSIHLDHAIGSLEVGKKADIVMISNEHSTMYPIHDPYSALVYSASAHDVSDVWIDGIQIVKDHACHIDQTSLRNELDVEMEDFLHSAMRIMQELDHKPSL